MSPMRSGLLIVAALLVVGFTWVTALGQGRDRDAPRAVPPIVREQQETDNVPRPGKGARKDAARVFRQVYSVRGSAAKELANALLAHFKAEPDFLAYPGAGNRILLLSGPKSMLQEAVALLNDIDRPQQVIRIDVLILELTGNEASKDLERDLTGSARDVLGKVRDLEQRGVLARVHHVQLATLERETVRAQAGENKPFVSGISSGGRGFAGGGGPGASISRSLTYRNVGTMVQVVKPELAPDGRVELQLLIEDTQMRTPSGAAEIGTDEKGLGVPAAEFVSFNLQCRLRLRPGQIVLEESNQVRSKTGQARKILLVGASAD